MALLSVLCLGILAIVHGAPETSWSPRLARRPEGYDLEKGPVFYEAYYPDDQNTNESPPDAIQEKRFFDHSGVLERSYQVPAGPYDLPYPPEDPSNQQPQRINYIQPNSVPFPTFVSDGLQSKENSQQSNDGFYPSREQPANDLQAQGSTLYVPRGRVIFSGRDLKPNQHFIFGEQPVDKLSEIRVWNEPSSNGNQHRDGLERQEFEDTQSSKYRSAGLIEPILVENIFEPRPQVVKYVFSVPKEVKASEPTGPVEEDVMMDWPRSYGDNILQEEIRLEDERELKEDEKEAEVASIQVSEMPRHKIRHHHGERHKRAFLRH